jgi:hypothetical protein
MKRKSLLYFSAFLLVAHLANAQQSTFPILADTPKWCMVATKYNGGDPLFFYSTFEYSYQKDTLVEGKTYSKLRTNFNSQFAVLVRNENKKTFIRRGVPTPTVFAFTSESILYDFNMNSVNDSLIVPTTVGPYNANPSENIVVKFISSDSVLFNGINRKRIKLKYYNPRAYLPTLRDMVWIEGFGIVTNPLYDCLLLFDTYMNTMGLDIKGQRVYQDSVNANGCSPKRVGVGELSFNDMSIYPNPIIDQLNIVMPTVINEPFAEIIVQDLVGKTVFRERLQNLNGPLSINLAHLNAGMYIVSLQTQSKRLFSKKIVKTI